MVRTCADNPPSAFLAVFAVDSAIPRRRPFGEMTKALDQLLILLIQTGARFAEDDVAAIRKHCGLRSCAGVFDPCEVGYYSYAVANGNASFCRSWEKALQFPPWRGRDGRIAYGSRVVIEGLEATVTTFQKDLLVICAYRKDDRGRNTSRIARRWRFNRDEWTALQQAGGAL